MDNLYAGILRRISVANGRAPIRRPVIDENELEIPIGLRKDAVDAALQILLDVIYRNND